MVTGTTLVMAGGTGRLGAALVRAFAAKAVPDLALHLNVVLNGTEARKDVAPSLLSFPRVNLRYVPGDASDSGTVSAMYSAYQEITSGKPLGRLLVVAASIPQHLLQAFAADLAHGGENLFVAADPTADKPDALEGVRTLILVNPAVLCDWSAAAARILHLFEQGNFPAGSVLTV